MFVVASRDEPVLVTIITHTSPQIRNSVVQTGKQKKKPKKNQTGKSLHETGQNQDTFSLLQTL